MGRGALDVLHGRRWLRRRGSIGQLTVLAFALVACGDESTEGAGDTEPQVVEGTATSADGQLIWYRAIGGSASGARTLLLINDGPGSSHHYLAGFEQLATSSLRIVTYDQRGMGGSPLAQPANPDYGMDRHIEDIDAILGSLGVASFVLLGHSWGGFIAQNYAIARSERLESLVLLSSIPATEAALRLANGARQTRIVELQAQGHIVDPLPVDGCEWSAAVRPASFHDPTFEPPPELLATQCSHDVNADTWAVCVEFGYDLTASLAALQLPVLVATGASDFFAGVVPSHASAFEPDATQQLIPDSGHLPWMEAPDEVFSMVRDFVGAP
ncbi:MAG: alpha/beta fold hydrolase [Deltaproteobacteria bacterium]|nr:alpha/beta fold hydrolase [Deltaproteobacteria bacterium]MBW2532983.1 alpha/beta fold hydrolase [Deltaproteobacteria bacterium]